MTPNRFSQFTPQTIHGDRTERSSLDRQARSQYIVGMASATEPARELTAARPVESLIHVIRGQKVMFDADLAALYGVETRRLNEAVKRNRDRFPETFMFRLTPAEAAHMRSQFATSSKRKIK